MNESVDVNKDLHLLKTTSDDWGRVWSWSVTGMFSEK